MNIIDIGLIIGYVLVGLCALAAIIMPLIQSLDNPKSLIKSGIGVGALIVIFFICYAVTDADIPDASESTAKFVGAGILTTYVAFFVAIGGIVYTEISKLTK